jgi:hypothetical protein
MQNGFSFFKCNELVIKVVVKTNLKDRRRLVCVFDDYVCLT